MFKQRLRKRYHEWKTYKELKQIALDEWQQIRDIWDGTKSVRRRIREMPWRYEQLRKIGGQRIRTNEW